MKQVTYLIILKPDFHFKTCWHLKFVSFNRVKMMLMLLFLLIIHRVLPLHLLDLVWVVYLTAILVTFHLVLVLCYLSIVHLAINDALHLLICHLHRIFVDDFADIHLLVSVRNSFHIHDLLLLLLLGNLLIFLLLFRLTLSGSSVSVFLLSFLLFTHIFKL